ncbi:MAG: hypothetical protein A2044_03575 [Candidatus Firestonebacteria bacterium GWA2_43_8]|nr:MAG: hypothetical protein A2044_03575 [Candidatus Firestonebacteria bacterium GWA2_43_8]
MKRTIINDVLTEKIIGCCFAVHNEMGPGFVEKIYHEALLKNMSVSGLEVEKEKVIDVKYEGAKVGNFKADLLVGKKVIVEIKAISGVLPAVFENQVISYLKASRLNVGLLVNFGNRSCQVKRFVNKYSDRSTVSGRLR